MIAGALVHLLLAQPVPVNIDPSDVDDQLTPLLACDAFACSVAWTHQDMNGEYLSMRWLAYDGGAGPTASTTGGSPEAVLQGGGASGGARFVVYTPTGALGDRTVNVLVTHAPFESLLVATAQQVDSSYSDVGRAVLGVGPQAGVLAYVAEGQVGPQVYLRGVGSDGGFTEDASVKPAQGGNEALDPSIAALNGVFYVLYTDRFDTVQFDPYLARFTSPEAPLGQPIQLDGTPDDEKRTALVARGDHLLAAWSRFTATPQTAVVRIELDGGRGPPLLQLPGAGPALTWLGRYGCLALGGPTGAELYRLDDSDGGLTAQLWFSSLTANANPFVSLQQPDGDRAWLAFESDDGGLARSFYVVVALDAGSTVLGPDAGGSGLPDAGPGVTPGAPRVETVSCGCSQGAWGLLALAALMGLKRKSNRQLA